MPSWLLIVSALAEVPVGIALLVAPSLVAGLLLGVTLDAPAAVIVARVAGAGVLSLGIACWLARRAVGRDAAPVVTAMLFYNSASVGVLAHAGAGTGLAGVLLWPAVVLHAVLGAWCIAALRSN